ncbi:MAG: tripartite tricarboxylate transporter TctB family protein [Deltaproteobacteria bacterium]|nr:tripartite tricarboxylate transporter TctB family protein [Deltaproteobacteria bacterium]
MSTRSINILTAVCISTISIILLGQLKGIPREGTIFPAFILYGLIACSALMAIRSLLPRFKKEKVIVFKDIPPVLWLMVVILFVLYVAGVFHVGFFASTFWTSLLVTTALSHSHWKRALLANISFALGITIFFYLIFSNLLRVPFPRGLLM